MMTSGHAAAPYTYSGRPARRPSLGVRRGGRRLRLHIGDDHQWPSHPGDSASRARARTERDLSDHAAAAPTRSPGPARVSVTRHMMMIRVGHGNRVRVRHRAMPGVLTLASSDSESPQCYYYNDDDHGSSSENPGPGHCPGKTPGLLAVPSPVTMPFKFKCSHPLDSPDTMIREA